MFVLQKLEIAKRKLGYSSLRAYIQKQALVAKLRNRS